METTLDISKNKEVDELALKFDAVRKMSYPVLIFLKDNFAMNSFKVK